VVAIKIWIWIVGMEKEEKQAVMAAGGDRGEVLGAGVPALSVAGFKDGMGVATSSLQILQASANLPMVVKPLLGLFSDARPLP
jgi:hypothetical protein